MFLFLSFMCQIMYKYWWDLWQTKFSAFIYTRGIIKIIFKVCFILLYVESSGLASWETLDLFIYRTGIAGFASLWGLSCYLKRSVTQTGTSYFEVSHVVMQPAELTCPGSSSWTMSAWQCESHRPVMIWVFSHRYLSARDTLMRVRSNTL